jgi:transposase-like protein
MKGKPYPPEFVDMILEQVKTSSKSVAEVARENGLNENLLYAWIKKHSSNPTNQNALLLENQRLKKEKQQLIDLIGRLTVNLDQLKKKDV